MRKALLGFVSVAEQHKHMSEYDWKGKILSPGQHKWFSSIGRTWLSNSRRSDRLTAPETREASDDDYMKAFAMYFCYCYYCYCCYYCYYCYFCYCCYCCQRPLRLNATCNYYFYCSHDHMQYIVHCGASFALHTSQKCVPVVFFHRWHKSPKTIAA